jgi:medium-chain acyl-CoA synthetase
MAHSHRNGIQRPEKFNFAVDVIDYWAAKSDNMKAMYWVSQDQTSTRTMTFKYFSRQSHRICALLQRLGVKSGDTMIMILPRVPAW